MQKIISEGSNKFARTKFPGNGKRSLSEIVEAITVYQTENSFKFVLKISFVSKDNQQIFKIIAVPVTGKNSELFIATEIDSYIDVDFFFYFTTKDKVFCEKIYCEAEFHLRK